MNYPRPSQCVKKILGASLSKLSSGFYIHIYTLLHELACNIASYCTSGRGIFTSRRRVKMQPTSAITAICTLTSVIKYLLSITTTASCLFSHKVLSSSPFERTGSN